LLACRTERTNSIPSENSAPNPSATAIVAGITARTSGIRNASRNRTGASSSPPAVADARDRLRSTGASRAIIAAETRKVAASNTKTEARGRSKRSLPGRAATSAYAAAPIGIIP